MRLLTSLAVAALFAAPAVAADPTLELTLVAKKATLPYAGGDKSPKDYKAELDELVAKVKKGENAKLPAPAEADFVLKITNTGKEAVTTKVGGDVNMYKFEIEGDGVIAVAPPLAFTADFRIGKDVTIEPGKSHEIPVAKLADGTRGNGRWIYLTAPGEYKVVATYQLASDDGMGKGPVLKSKPVTIKVEDKK